MLKQSLTVVALPTYTTLLILTALPPVTYSLSTAATHPTSILCSTYI